MINVKRAEKIRKEILSADFIKKAIKDLKILSEPSRLKIILSLRAGKELSVNEIALIVNLTPSAISHQLRILRNHGFVKFRKRGKEVHYSLFDSDIEDMTQRIIHHLKNRKF
jgi:DNA-binding transcriptional ArsR family regulator